MACAAACIHALRTPQPLFRSDRHLRIPERCMAITSHGSGLPRTPLRSPVPRAGERGALGPQAHAWRPLRALSIAQSTTSFQLPPLRPLDENYEAVHCFTDYANWLIPGHLLVGRYPYVEPSRCKDRAKGEDQLMELVQAGCTTFISLQAEIPAQEKLPIRGMGGFLPYKSTVLLQASAHYGPPPMAEVEGLRNRNLDKFLPPRRKPKAYADPRPELQFLHCPIEDLSVPTGEQLRDYVDKVVASLQAGERVYLHCWGGRGRAGLVGACVLATIYGISADEALERVQRSFDTRQDGGRRSPETDEQIALVKAFVSSARAAA